MDVLEYLYVLLYFSQIVVPFCLAVVTLLVLTGAFLPLRKTESAVVLFLVPPPVLLVIISLEAVRVCLSGGLPPPVVWVLGTITLLLLLVIRPGGRLLLQELAVRAHREDAHLERQHKQDDALRLAVRYLTCRLQDCEPCQGENRQQR